MTLLVKNYKTLDKVYDRRMEVRRRRSVSVDKRTLYGYLVVGSERTFRITCEMSRT